MRAVVGDQGSCFSGAFAIPAQSPAPDVLSG